MIRVPDNKLANTVFVLGRMKTLFMLASGTPRLRSGFLAAALAFAPVAGAALVCLQPSVAAAESATQRVIQGKVYDSGEVPQPGAIIYLKSAKTNTIKSYIATEDGSYRFGQLTTEADYSLWAELRGRKSAVKSISAFDSKKQFLINLHLSDKEK